jgi:hypothetical protein
MSDNGQEIVGPSYTDMARDAQGQPMARCEWAQKRLVCDNIEKNKAQRSLQASVMRAKPREGSGSVVEGSKAPLTPQWCAPDLTKMQCRRVQKLRAQEMKEQKQEAERGLLFNQERPMTVSQKLERKHIEKEEKSDDSDDDNVSQGGGCQ